MVMVLVLVVFRRLTLAYTGIGNTGTGAGYQVIGARGH